jgi:hypothetical protein
MFKFISEEPKEPEKPVEVPEKQETNDEKFFTIKGPINKFLNANPKKKRFRWLSASKISDVDVYDFVYGYFLGYEEEWDFNGILMAETGTVIHKVMQDQLSNIGILTDIERGLFCPKYGFCGRIDGIIESGKIIPKSKKISNELMHFEIKTCTDYAYQNLVMPCDIPDYHKCQAEIYQNMLGVKKTLFCYVSRVTYSYKCMVYEGTGSHYERCRRKAEEIWKYIGRRELPHYNLISKEKWDESIKDVDVPLKPEDIVVDDQEKEKADV